MLPNGLRTYRPKLDQYVFCSKQIEEQVLSWVRGVPEGKVSRNLMVTGASGLGKTTLGLAACQKLGAHPNCIQEINCASMRTLDDARSLLETLVFAPARGTYRVLILDECHQMVPNAQQAFLTPLEQLAPTTIVIACTSNPENLLPAFKRRFYEIKISEYDDNAMIEILSSLPAELKPSAIASIVEVAGGNPGRAIALAESSTLSPEENPLVQEILLVENFFQALVESNTKKLFLYSQQIKDENRKLFFDKLLRYIESAWMISAGLNSVLPSKELAIVQANVERMSWRGASLQEQQQKRMGFFSGLYLDLLTLSEKPIAYVKAWAMKRI